MRRLNKLNNNLSHHYNNRLVYLTILTTLTGFFALLMETILRVGINASLTAVNIVILTAIRVVLMSVISGLIVKINHLKAILRANLTFFAD